MGAQPTAAELVQIQADAVAAVCDKTCIVQRAITVKDGLGTSTPAYTTINTTVAGMSQPSAGELQNYAYAIEDKAAWTVRLPIATDVMAQDWLIIDGQTLEVHILLNPRSFEIFHSVIAAELKPS